MFFVYIVANKRDGVLYIGHTDNLDLRMEQHKSNEFKGFTRKYGCNQLVWYELHETRDSAFMRERQMKKWNRAWKIRQIVKLNPYWDDLFPYLTDASLYDERRFHNAAAL